MRSAAILYYPYEAFTNRAKICCITLNAKNAAISSAVYIINISILVVFVYGWRIHENSKYPEKFEDVYYGVQISYISIITFNMLNMSLALMLLYAILKEKYYLISFWMIGFLSFTSVEVVCTVYSNALRDHVNKKFDTLSKEEALFLGIRVVLIVFPIAGVLRFYIKVQENITWRGKEAVSL